MRATQCAEKRTIRAQTDHEEQETGRMREEETDKDLTDESDEERERG
jgi:hypothetical protein